MYDHFPLNFLLKKKNNFLASYNLKTHFGLQSSLMF